MKNCWVPAMRQFIYDDPTHDEVRFYLFRYTRKNKYSWLAPLWLRKVVGWAFVMPLLVLFNLAVWTQTGRWIHIFYTDGTKDEAGAWILREFVPPDEDYRERLFPDLSFDGTLQDSGKRLVDGIICRGE